MFCVVAVPFAFAAVSRELALTRRCGQALDFAHKNGIMHRDGAHCSHPASRLTSHPAFRVRSQAAERNDRPRRATGERRPSAYVLTDGVPPSAMRSCG
jgi:hypothetical protein